MTSPLRTVVIYNVNCVQVEVQVVGLDGVGKTSYMQCCNVRMESVVLNVVVNLPLSRTCTLISILRSDKITDTIEGQATIDNYHLIGVKALWPSIHSYSTSAYTKCMKHIKSQHPNQRVIHITHCCALFLGKSRACEILNQLNPIESHMIMYTEDIRYDV